MVVFVSVPLDLPACDARLVGEDVAVEELDLGLGRWVLAHLGVRILIRHKVADADELTILVAHCQHQRCHTHQILVWDLRPVGWLNLFFFFQNFGRPKKASRENKGGRRRSERMVKERKKGV